VSNFLAIAAVTSTLRNILIGGLADLPGVTVTTRPLDQARTGTERPSQLNLFLYQTEPNPALSNADPPGRVRPGEVARPALALDLKYLVTAFGLDDDETDGHRVLGRAMSVLHDHPVLDGAAIESALPESDLADQVERVRTTPWPLSLDEISNLWNAFQTQYRLSSAYRTSVVLIDSAAQVRAALPVLTRGSDDTGVRAQSGLTPPFPTLTALGLPDARPSAHLGDTITLTGHHLDGDVVVPILRHRRLPDTIDLTPVTTGSPTSVQFELPDDPTGLLVGVWGVALRVLRAGEQDRITNEVPFALAPQILGIDPDPAPRIGGGVTLTITVTPEVRREQTVALLVSDREVPPGDRPPRTAILEFEVRAVTPGDHVVRLRIDGVDSVLVDRTTSPPSFDPAHKVTVT
jgi:hypothetical protein